MNPKFMARGRMNQSQGDLFEGIFENRCIATGLPVERIPAGCVQAGKKIIRVPTPFDWLCTWGGTSAFIDTKSCGELRFTFSDIKPHQLDALEKQASQGAVAGYLIWFRPIDGVFWYPSSFLKTIQPRGGFGPEHGYKLGSVMTFQPKAIWFAARQSTP